MYLFVIPIDKEEHHNHIVLESPTRRKGGKGVLNSEDEGESN